MLVLPHTHTLLYIVFFFRFIAANPRTVVILRMCTLSPASENFIVSILSYFEHRMRLDSDKMHENVLKNIYWRSRISEITF